MVADFGLWEGDLMKPEEMKPHYHRLESCNWCGKVTNRIVRGSFDSGEAKTECKSCGHEDFWAYGFFESSESIESKCKKYVNLNGKLINI